MNTKTEDNYLKKELYELIKTDESIFDFIQESSLDGLWYWDLENPENEWMNPKFWTVLGYNPDEMPHKASAWQDIINQDDLKKAIENFTKHCENPNHPYDQIVRYTHKNGSIVWIRCRGIAIRDENGKPVRMLGAHHDITDIKNKESEIKESEEKFKYYIENSPTSIFIVNSNGKYIYVNPSACKLLKYSSKELLNMSIPDILPKEQIIDGFNNFLELKEKGETHNFEIKLKQKDGKYIDVVIDGKKISENEYIAYVKDISERKYVEAITRQNAHRLKILHDLNLFSGIETANIFDLALEKAIELCNSEIGFLGFLNQDETIVKIHAWSASVMKICEVKDKYIDFEVSKTGIWGEVIRHRKPLIINDFKSENPLKRGTPQGHVEISNYLSVPIFDTGKIVAVVAVGNKEFDYNETDIQELTLLMDGVWQIVKQRNYEKEIINAKEKAEESEARYRLVADNTIDSIWVMDAGLRFTYLSPSTEKLFGYTLKEWETLDWNIFVHQNDIQIVLDVFQNLKTKKGNNCQASVRVYHKNGNEMWVEFSANPLFDEHENFIGTVGITRDITERKKLLTEIEKSSQVYKNVIQSIPIGMFIYQYKAPDKLLLIEGNNSAEKLTGIKVTDWIGKEFNEIWPNAKDAGITDSYLKVAKTGIGIEMLDVYYTDERVSGAFRIYAFQFDNDKIAIAFLNITEIKKAEEDLQKAKVKVEESEKQFRQLFENMEQGFALHEMIFENNKPIDYKFILINKAFEKLTGIDARNFINKTVKEVLPNSEQIWIDNYGKVAQSGIPLHFESYSQDFDKYYEVIAYSPKQNYFAVVFTDVTKNKIYEKEMIEAKEKAEENEKQYKSLSESSKDYIMRFDKNFRHLYINKITCDLLQIEPEQLLYKTHKESGLFANEQCDFWEQNIKKVFETKETVQLQFDFFNGFKTIYFDWMLIPEKNENGEVENVLSVSRDITNIKQYELELKEAKEKAEESDRLKTAFLQNMSHEIRTPLNAISGFSGFLNDNDLSAEERKSFVSIIQNSSNQLISIVTDILTISSLETKQEKTNISNVCVNRIIVELLAIFIQQAQNQNISLYAKQQLNDKQSEIYTDKTKFTQILSNLLSNALKFTHEGFIEFGYNLKDNVLEFYVKDSGIGIKPEFHAKIFERFRQADNSINNLYGGTGLGLAISKAFVELLGGNIWVSSEIEKGSTFYFTIPYKPVNEIDNDNSPTKQNENFKTIIVAEDEEFNFLYIEVILNKLNLKIIHTKDGKETVEVFKANPEIDLILMDIKMPIMTGHEAAKIIKEIKPDLPIVAQSAYALEHERAKYEEIFDDYLTKPINKNDLIQKVKKYIEK